MRLHRIIAGVSTVAIGWALGAAGCIADSSTTEPGGEAACDDLLVQERCFDCLETSCCEEVRTCIDDREDGGCAACIGGDADACTKAKAALALYVCLVQGCQVECGPDAPGPQCDAPAKPSSKGSCVKLDDAATCNPVTNEGCDAEAGEVCDYDKGRYLCYPAPNDQKVCEACGPDAGFCGAGMTCFQSVSIGAEGLVVSGACGRACCDDGDCGAGTCQQKVDVSGGSVGVCIEGEVAP